MTRDQYIADLIEKAPPLAPWQREVIGAALAGSLERGSAQIDPCAAQTDPRGPASGEAA